MGSQKNLSISGMERRRFEEAEAKLESIEYFIKTIHKIATAWCVQSIRENLKEVCRLLESAEQRKNHYTTQKELLENRLAKEACLIQGTPMKSCPCSYCEKIKEDEVRLRECIFFVNGEIYNIRKWQRRMAPFSAAVFSEGIPK